MSVAQRLTSGGRSFELTPDRVWVVGRDASADIVLEHDLISRRHLEVRPDGDGWTVVDLGSRNGTWMAGARTESFRVTNVPVHVRLGGPLGLEVGLAPLGDRDPMALADESPDPSSLGRLTAVHQIATRDTRVGRSPDNDLVIDDLTVSRYHALVRLRPDGVHEILDLGSSNGTFVNGRPAERTVLADGDVVSIGGHLFRFVGDTLREYSEALGAWLSAAGIWVRVQPHVGLRDRIGHVVTRGGPAEEITLLHDVGFAVGPATFLGIVGPSGAGKTTLLRALTGQRRASVGKVLYGGRDLYEAEDLRRRMGYVPQDDLLHPQLTVRQALAYAAELRFAADVDADTRLQRVEQVMDELGLSERADLVISKLSGGQRKRTSVAAELLTRPSLLFLDEPTSGLDPGNEEQLTELLRSLADGGRTVVAATHSLVTLERCDRVLFLARGGYVAYFGPPAQAMPFFRRHGLGGDYPKVFGRLKDDGGAAIAASFQGDPVHDEYLEEPLTRSTALGTGVVAPVDATVRSDRARQFSVLTRRYLTVLRADRASALILVAQAPFFAFLFALLYPTNVMRSSNASEATILLWLMVVGATWMGTSNGIREIVKELPIIRREHGLGVSLSAYLGSKVAVLSVITALQCAFLALAMVWTQVLPAIDNMRLVDQRDAAGHLVKVPFHSPATISAGGALIPPQLVELTIDVVMVGLASLAIGLLLSSLARNPDQANFMLPLVLVAQVVLSAPIVGSPGPVFAAMGTAATAQWGTAAAAATIDLNTVRRPYLFGVESQRAPGEGHDPDASVWEGRSTWDHDAWNWTIDTAALVALAFAALAAAYQILRRALGHGDAGALAAPA